ncbi:MAG: Fur family transcriptional regulator [Candidatus Thorarchaeota archaeon]
MDTKKLMTLFKKNRLKLTPQRLAIYNLISSRKDHPNTDAIYKLLKEEYPTISLGTVYSTLHLFKDLGLIQELNFSDGNIRYDPNTDIHINLICSKCGKITDYTTEKVKKLWQAVISDINVEAKGQRLDLYYECEKCRKV